MRPIDAARPVLAGFQVTDAAQDQPTNSGVTPEMADTVETAPQSTTPVADPLARSLVQVRLNQNVGAAPALDGAGPSSGTAGVLYTKSGETAAPATKQNPITVPPEVADVLAEGAKNPEARKEFTTAQRALAAGDYTTAYQAMESLMRKQGEDVLTADQVKSAQTVRDQLGLLSDMQKAGIKADYPPTESQLVSYFKTLKGNPEAARQAFATYTESFHVHPANVTGQKPDISYQETTVKRGESEYRVDDPHDWSEVSQRTAPGSQFAGRQMNDCQGYAYIAGKLLGAAGFQVAHNIDVVTKSSDSAHAMVAFTHPKEKGYTVTSDDQVFHGNTEKGVAQQAYEHVVGEGKLTGKEHYYTGKTQVDAHIECVIKDHEL